MILHGECKGAATTRKRRFDWRLCCSYALPSFGGLRMCVRLLGVSR